MKLVVPSNLLKQENVCLIPRESEHPSMFSIVANVCFSSFIAVPVELPATVFTRHGSNSDKTCINIQCTQNTSVSNIQANQILSFFLHVSEKNLLLS